jgi:hypothetical protein
MLRSDSTRAQVAGERQEPSIQKKDLANSHIAGNSRAKGSLNRMARSLMRNDTVSERMRIIST